MTPTVDVVILGAGIVGAACAAEAAAVGLRVAVIEEHGIGGGTTAAGMGHIVVMDDSEPQFALTRYSQQLWTALKDQLPVDVEYVESGTLWIATDEEEMAEVRRKQAFYETRRVPVQVLDSQALREAEPCLRPGLQGGLLVMEDSVIYPPCAARYLLENRPNIEVFQGRKAISITANGVRLADGSEISGGCIVNALGCWSPQLTPGLDIQKRKGHLVITDRYPGFLRHQLIELGYLKSAHSLTADSVAFNLQPRRTGQILIGSSRQYGVEHSEADSVILGKMLQRAFDYVPQIAKLSALRVWTGFRAATPDKLPLIGRHPAQKNLYLATGHEGLGITTSLATGKLLVDQILGRESAIPVAPYLPERVAHVST